MVLPLDAMLTSTVAPALRAAGFRRKGRKFSIVNELGDLALIEVSTDGKMALGDGYRHFWVQPWLLPEPYADLWQFRGAPYTSGKEQGVPLWQVSSRPPFVSRWPTGGAWVPTLWAFREDDPANVTECGQAVVEALVPAVVSTLRRLLDRETLIEEVRRADAAPELGPDSTPLHLGISHASGLGSQVLPLLADAGDTAAVAGLLRATSGSWLAAGQRGNPYTTSLVGWASARLASRGAPNLGEFLDLPIREGGS